MATPNHRVRTLAIVLGDQLDHASVLWDDFEPEEDLVWMAEVAEESTHVWSHQARIAIFLASMRHFRDALEERGRRVEYRELPADVAKDTFGSFADALSDSIDRLRPERLSVVLPGEHRVLQMLEKVASDHNIELEILADRHFFTTPEEFATHARGRKQLRLEYFYRELRKRFDVLMEGGEPAGGEWNYDKQNRGAFGKRGPGELQAPVEFEPDAITRVVLELVAARFADHPGELESFDWPVTADEAQSALDDFVEHRLPEFGEYQDAMWTDEPWLYHSRLSAAMNLKLLNPRAVVQAAVDAYHRGSAPLAAVEGFVRQVLGWREYVRGVYWLHMPKYLGLNALDANAELPDFYWTGETDYACLRQAITQTLRHGYAHHIQRLMVTGLFAMLLGVLPRSVHEWYLAVYVDAVEWVELPNTLGMSQYADGGIMASKPYAATGKYIHRMSNYCQHCPSNPAEAVGNEACPFTTLYWDFLDRHREQLGGNRRMALQIKNLERKSPQALGEIREEAQRLRKRLAKGVSQA